MRYRTLTALSILLGCAGNFILAEDLAPEKERREVFGPQARKLDARLVPALNSLHAHPDELRAARELKRRHGRALAATAAAEELVVRVDAHVTKALLEKIGATGAKITHAAPRWNTISLHATLSQIDKLAGLEEIRFISLQAGKRFSSMPGWEGSCPNEAFSVMNVNNLPASLTGEGQTVGVVSNSVDVTFPVIAAPTFSSSGTAPYLTVRGMIPQNTGNLPATVQVVDPGLPDDLLSDTDEGEAMLELIHNVAPGAALAFGACDDTQVEMADNISLLRTAANCNIIADDVLFLDEPFFQDGPIAQAITANYNDGVVHFSAFGNEGASGALAAFTPMNPELGTDYQAWQTPTGEAFHNWGIGGAAPAFLPIKLPAEDELIVVLEWNQPFMSYNLGPGSQASMDMYLYATPAIVNYQEALSYTLGVQGTAGQPYGDPVAILAYPNTGRDTTVYLCINHYAGDLNNVMRLVFYDTGGANGAHMSFPSGGVGGMTAFGHPTSFNCVGVGAMFWDNPALSNNLVPEAYSSQGGGFGSLATPAIPYYFDASGNPLPGAPVLRNAPDIMAPDGCSTSTVYFWDGYYQPVPGNPNLGNV